MQHELPLHPTNLVRWREWLGDQLESLLEHSLHVARQEGLLGARELERVNVDTTVQERVAAFPTDVRLYQKTRVALVRTAQDSRVVLRQSYRRVGKVALVMQGRYARARQMRRPKTWLGRVVRDIERKMPTPTANHRDLLPLAKRLRTQQRQDSGKLYSVHAPEVECIAKGKAHKRYEFGCKVLLATTSKGNWLVAAASLPRNPYDGHTLEGALAQVERLIGRCPVHAYCDLGYRGHGVSGEPQVHLVGKIPKKSIRAARRWMKRQAAIEPTIGHLKSDYRLSRN